MKSYWEKEYRRKGFKAQRKYPNEALIRFLAIDVVPHSTILELGCGTGANLWAIAKEGHTAHGVDYAKTGLDLCRQNLALWGVGGTVRLADIGKKIPYPDHYFDAIVDVVSMQHLTIVQHQRCLREVRRCLKPGGKFFGYHLGAGSTSFIASHGRKLDDSTVANISRGLPLHGNGPTCFLSISRAKTLLRSAGFKDITIETVVRTYNARQQKIEYLVITAA